MSDTQTQTPAVGNVKTLLQRLAETATPMLHVDDASDFIQEVLPPRPMLLQPFLAERTMGMLHSWRGIGKTHFGLGFSAAVATGGTFLKWTAPTAAKVTYFDGEMAQEDIQLWLCETLTLDGMPELMKGYLNIVAADRNDIGIPSLSTAEGQKLAREAIADSKLVIFDNISCLFRGGDEKEGMDWESAQEWLLGLRREGIATLLLHHDGKSGQQRGTSKREDPMDWVMHLKHPSDYLMEQGLRVEVHLEKARRLHGLDARPFEAALITDPQGKVVWAVKELADAIAEAVRMMRDEKGMSFPAIGKALGGKHPMHVTRLYERAKKAMEAPEAAIAEAAERSGF